MYFSCIFKDAGLLFLKFNDNYHFTLILFKYYKFFESLLE